MSLLRIIRHKSWAAIWPYPVTQYTLAQPPSELTHIWFLLSFLARYSKERFKRPAAVTKTDYSHLISRANISCYNFLQQIASDWHCIGGYINSVCTYPPFYYTKAQITEQDLLNFSHKVTYKKAIASTTPVACTPTSQLAHMWRAYRSQEKSPVPLVGGRTPSCLTNCKLLARTSDTSRP